MSLSGHTCYPVAKMIATIAADYEGELPGSMNTARVIRWIDQFPEKHRLPLLEETAHILGKSYISKSRLDSFLDSNAVHAKLTANNPKDFWANTQILEIQERGNSQQEMVAALRARLKASGFQLGDSPTHKAKSFIYLDDILFTGGHLIHDLTTWIKTDAPQKGRVIILVAALHRGAVYRAQKANNNLNEIALLNKKDLDFEIWRLVELEDRLRYSNSSDVLRPKAPPPDAEVKAYATELDSELAEASKKYGKTFSLQWRPGDGIGDAKLFSSVAARVLYEEQMLIAGCRIRAQSPNFQKIRSARPLGFQSLTSVGFGGLIITYRNCPNNCPMAWWAGDPWYPLFPRRTNSVTAISRLFGTLS
jgi:hypothetical protein